MKSVLFSVLVVACMAAVLAQSSANYSIEQGTLNNGGNPSPALSSPNFQVAVDSIGDGLALTGMASPSYGMDAGFPPDYRPPQSCRICALPARRNSPGIRNPPWGNTTPTAGPSAVTRATEPACRKP